MELEPSPAPLSQQDKIPGGVLPVLLFEAGLSQASAVSSWKFNCLTSIMELRSQKWEEQMQEHRASTL